MFNVRQKSTGTGYTTTVALLVVAFIFSPAILVASRPLSYLSVSLSITCSGLCVALAWVNWTRFSQRSMPSIVSQKGAAK